MRAWALALLVACGGDDAATPIDASTVLPDAFVADAAPGGPGNALSTTLFVNTEGVTVTMSGTDDATANTSTIPMVATATLAKYLATDAARTTKIDDIKQQLDGILSPYNITVTLTRPAAGPYDMIVVTDSSSTTLGLPGGTISAVPTSCNTVASVIGFNFATGSSRDDVVQQAIALFGITGGIPPTSKAGDCMCIDTTCTALSAPCTIGKANTPISSQRGCAAAGETTIDENAKFIAAYGTH